jgi:hypothetical protein
MEEIHNESKSSLTRVLDECPGHKMVSTKSIINSVQKLIWLFIGYLATGLLYFALRYFMAALPDPGYGGESIWGLLFLIVIPVSIYIGSIITGYNLSKIDDKRLINSIIYNPGFLFSVTFFIKTLDIPVFVKNNEIQAMIGLFIYLILYMAVSSAGIYYGYKIHRGRFKKAAG